LGDLFVELMLQSFDNSLPIAYRTFFSFEPLRHLLESFLLLNEPLFFTLDIDIPLSRLNLSLLPDPQSFFLGFRQGRPLQTFGFLLYFDQAVTRSSLRRHCTTTGRLLI
jgi:hypothetical protein